MEVCLIRHTTPIFEPGMIYGRTELLLHADFPAELEAVRAKLGKDFEIMYSSPALRCIQLARALYTDVLTDPRLQELDFGGWEGKTWNTVDQQALQAWMDDFVNVCTPGGESMMQMYARVEAFWKELGQSGYDKVAIVTHAGVIRLILSIVRQIDLQDIFNINVSYGEVIRVEVH
ncbi:alpha-ribazole phosphatase family protein [Dyadobacter sp. CY261]|uniref:alpha-ribazole phosphatase family protein n=1 Tax=Dyadobacter sp. CY261 TaxID=2907203 RepID=UPI001F30440D|nr:alpha-ribazole phosphatase family protein [Dyadobacter sp. CY261]MCF0071145.1 alpha-ribazole phosphatase family protein [Dyadobacter sp. CY261]